MRTLILSEENYERLVSLPGVLELLAAPQPALPEPRELRAMARGDQTPEAFARGVAYRDAGRQAAEDTRVALEALILQAYDAGVRPGALARWAGLRPRRIYDLTHEEVTA